MFHVKQFKREGKEMTTVRGKSGRRYDVEHTIYGTRNHEYRLYFGGVFLATTASGGPKGESSTSFEDTIIRADERAERLGLEVGKD